MSNIIDYALTMGQSNPDGRQASPVNPLAEADGTLTGLQLWNHTAYAFQPWRIGVNNGSYINTSNQWDFFGYALKLFRDWQGVDLLHCLKVTKGGIALHPTTSALGSFYWDTTQVVTSDKMFDVLYSKIEAVHFALARQGKQARCRAILFHQGEGDYLSGPASEYGANLDGLVLRTRRLVGNEDCPVIAGNIPEASLYYNATVNAALASAVTTIPNFHLVDLSEGTLFDTAHMDYDTKIFFGDATFELLKTVW